MSVKSRLLLLAGTLFLLLVLFPVYPSRGAAAASPDAPPTAAAGGARAKIPGSDWPASLLRLGSSTILVLALAGASVFGLSRLQRFRARPGGRRVLGLVETLPLGARRRLHLARVGERLILLAETDREVALLLELGEGEARAEEPAAPRPNPAIPFGRVLRARSGEGAGS